MPGTESAAGLSARELTIGRVTDPAKLREIEDLQLLVWGGDPREVIPTHVLHIVDESGGVLLAAWDGDQIVGFVLGFLGRRDGRLYHVSHILGIHPDYQSRGLGATLKLAQREQALAQGLTLMTWTFDPLEARNAYFNLHKLGGTSRTYHVNFYGEMQDDLNRGMPSDRLMVEWRLDEERPRRDGPPAGAVSLLAAVDGRPVPREESPPPDAPLLVAVPSTIQALKRDDLATALAWRYAVREALSWAFEHGYRAVDFVGGAYLLERDPYENRVD